MMSLRLICAALLSAGFSFGVTMPHVFGDHMVLQARLPVAVWGWAAPGETVTVRFAGMQKQARATAPDGRWQVALDPIPASAEPSELIVADSQKTLTFRDVLLGEVWLCSGQSNMAKPVGEWRGQKPTLNYEEELRNANFPLIRMLQPRGARRSTPQEDFDLTHREGEYPNNDNRWTAVTPQSLDELKFSAAGYFFARRLFQTLKVPIGIINSSSGGSRIESWITPAGYASVPALATFAEAALIPGSKVEDSDLCTLYNGQVAPLVPFTIRGVLWYQGESNVYVGDGANYAGKMTALIQGWRAAWKRELPFYYVEIAPLLYHTTRTNLVVSPEAEPRLWEAQTACLRLPQTGMIVTTDLVDDLTDIHPRNKKDVGERLARWALNKDYGYSEIEVSGPMFRRMEIEGKKAILYFDHIGGGLVSRDNKPLIWFVIGGADGSLFPGVAEIAGDTVVVSSPRVAAPTVIHFGWDEAARPNLFNRDGLPALPFRTDNPFAAAQAHDN